ncbi:DsbA family protein [Erythrobacter sp. W53]|uniref:DsbA family protein n=1 Tax=Erythrobacteraceae TaxID=335929 RepID=UPI0036D2539D
MKQNLLSAVLALIFGFAGAGLWAISGLGNGLTREYLVANPEVLPDMAEALQRKQGAERLAQVEGEVTAAFPGAVLGNPNGTKTLVKFTDYGCGFCRTSLPDIERLIAADPDLKVVVREWPIFDGSEQAARIALAAAKQGKYPAFYNAMFAAGAPTPANLAKAAGEAGLDMDAAITFAQSDEASAEIAKNMTLARSLGFGGTPSWVAGDQVMEGAVGYDTLAEALSTEDS